MQTANYVEIFLCTGFCILGILFTVLKFKNLRTLLFPDYMLVFSIIFFALGPLISYFFGYGWRIGTVWTVENILFGYFCISLFILSLAIGSKVFRPQKLFLPQFTSGGRHSPTVSFIGALKNVKSSWIFGAFMIIWSIRLVYFSYGGGISGMNSVDVGLSIPYPIVVLKQFTQMLYIVIVFYALLQFLRPIRKNYLFLGMLVPELLFQTLQGRRELLFLIFFCGIAYFSVVNKINWKLLILAPLSVIFIITIYSKVFLTFRAATQAERDSIYSEGLADFVVQGAQAAMEADAEDANQLLQKNMIFRPRANNDWIFTVTSTISPLGAFSGESTIHAMMSALPRAFRPHKYWGDHASIIQNYLGLKPQDIADNFVANAYADFGILGVIIFGLSLSAFMNFGLLIAQKLYCLEPFFSVLIFVTLFYISINIEVSLNYFFVMIRNLTFLAFCGTIFGIFGLNSRIKEKPYFTKRVLRS